MEVYNNLSYLELNASITNIDSMFSGCVSLIAVPQFNTNEVTSMSSMFADCNNLSNVSIQNIINMCLNSNITNIQYKNLSNTNIYSPFYNTKFNNSYYQNRLIELTTAGLTY